MTRLRIQLLVGAILAVTAVGLYLQSAQRVTTPDVRTQMAINLKQCALGILSYVDVHGRYPDAYAPAPDGVRRSLWFRLLPFVEAEKAFRDGNVREAVPAFLAEGYDRTLPEEPYGMLSFAANLRLFGNETHLADADRPGVALTQPPPRDATGNTLCGLRPNTVRDGTSNTIGLTVRLAGCAVNDSVGNAYALAPAEIARLPGNKKSAGGFAFAGTHSEPASEAPTDDVLFQRFDSYQDSHRKCRTAPAVSAHGFGYGLHVAFADATVRRILGTTSPTTFQRLICPDDGQPIDNDWND